MKSRVSVIAFSGLLLMGGTACKRTTVTAGKADTPPAPPSADAFLILPGDYAQRTTVAELEARFGKDNVRKETVPEPRVVLFPEDPTRRAYVTFYEREDFKELARIFVNDPGSIWRGKHGTHIGMTFAKVRELNGKPFFYYGFPDEKRALVRDSWSPSLNDDDSKLGAFDVTEGDHLYFEIEFAPRDAAGADVTLPVDEQASSDDPRFPNSGDRIIVTGLGASSSLDDEWE